MFKAVKVFASNSRDDLYTAPTRMSFVNKVVIVTGASSGIGAATAIEFNKEGAQVVMVARNESKLNTVAEITKKNGKEPLLILADVSKDDDVKRIIDTTLKKFGQIDILVNNAGFARRGSLLDGNIVTAYDEVMHTNVRGVIQLTMLAAPHVIKTQGNIINISSIAGLTPPKRPTFIPYFVSKSALDQFTKGAAAELAPHGVRVNSVNPGPVSTDFAVNAKMDLSSFTPDMITQMTALGRVSKSVEIADVVLFLASEKAKGITGSIFVSDNGSMIK